MINNNSKIFRSVILKDISKKQFNFNLDIIDQPFNYIELIGYGIHETGSSALYTIDIPQLLDRPLLIHSSTDNTFMNFSHGLINSCYTKNINGSINCYISKFDANDDIISNLNIVFYFVLHY